MDCSMAGFPVLYHLPVCSNSRATSWWCHPTILYSVIPFCFQSFPASGSFPMNQLFTSGGQSTGALAPVPFSEYSGLISFRIVWFDLSYYGWLGFPRGLAGREPACKVVHLGSIPGLERSTGEGKGYPLQYSGLENSMDCIAHGVAELDTSEWLSLSLQMATCKQWNSYLLNLSTATSQ